MQWPEIGSCNEHDNAFILWDTNDCENFCHIHDIPSNLSCLLVVIFMGVLIFTLIKQLHIFWNNWSYTLIMKCNIKLSAQTYHLIFFWKIFLSNRSSAQKKVVHSLFLAHIYSPPAFAIAFPNVNSLHRLILRFD